MLCGSTRQFKHATLLRYAKYAATAQDALPFSIAMGRGPGGGVDLDIGLQPFQRGLQLIDQNRDDDDDTDHNKLPD